MLLIAALVLVPLAFDYKPVFFGGTVLVKAALTQLLIYSSASILLLSWLRGTIKYRFQRIQVVAFGLVLLTVLATVFSPYWQTAIVGTYPRSEGASTAVAYLVAFILGTQLVTHAVHLRQLLAAVSASGAAAAAYGLVQFVGLDPLSWQLPWDARFSFGTLGNPNYFGCYAVLTCFVSVGLALSSQTSRSKWGWWSVAMLQGVTTVTSFSRGALIAFAGGVVVLSLVLLQTRPRRPKGAGLPPSRLGRFAIGGLLGLVLLGFTGLMLGVSRRILDLLDPSTASLRVRVEIGRATMRVLAHRPVLGYGPDTLSVAVGPRKSAALASLVDPHLAIDSAHNLLLQTAAEIGLPGVVVLVALLVGGFVATWRFCALNAKDHPRATLLMTGALAGCAASVVGLMFNPTNPATLLTMWAVLGAMVAPASPARLVSAGSRGAKTLLAAALLVTVVCVLSTIPLLAASNVAAVLANPAAPAGQRLDAAMRAMRINPLAADYPTQAAVAESELLVESARVNPNGQARNSTLLQSGLEFIQTAIDMQPDLVLRRNVQLSLLVLGGKYVDPKLLATARDATTDVVQAMPFELSAGYWHALVLDESGDVVAAEAALNRILAIRPRYPKAARLLAEILVQSGRSESALQVLNRADPDGVDPETQAIIDRLGGAR